MLDKLRSMLWGRQHLRQHPFEVGQVVFHPVGAGKDHVAAGFIDAPAARSNIGIADD